MSDAALNLAVIVGWPVAPVAMVLIMLGWQATEYLWDHDAFGGLSRRPHRRRCVAKWRRNSWPNHVATEIEAAIRQQFTISPRAK